MKLKGLIAPVIGVSNGVSASIAKLLARDGAIFELDGGWITGEATQVGVEA